MFCPPDKHVGHSDRTSTYPSKHDKPNITLAKSVSMDDDDDMDEATSTETEAEAFLESYETMLRHQKDELAVTLCHLEPLLELLESKSPFGYQSKRNHTTPFTKEFTYASLKQALDEIEEDESLRFVATDIQWKLVLELLTENVVSDEEYISWAEIVMCYRTCIIGMQTLDQTPESNALRTRVRQRSLHMLSSFRPNRLEMKKSKKVPEGTKKSSMEWVDSFFIGGSMLLVGAIIFSIVQAATYTTSSDGSTSIEGLYPASLIPRPQAVAFSVDDLMIPGPVLSPYAVDALIIPGPKPTPFHAKDSNTDGILASEMHVTSPPSSVLEMRGETLRKPRVSKALIIGPLDPSPDKPQETLTTKPKDKIQQLESDENNNRITKKGLAVATVAGGTVAAGILAPMTTSLVGALGSTVPSIFSIGATVMISTLLAHGIRDFLASVFAKLRKVRRS